MSVTKKYIVIQLIGVLMLFILAVLNFSGGFYIFLLLNAAFVGLLLVDFFVSPTESVLEIERLKEQKLYFKAENEIIISVFNKYAKPLKITVKDEVPGYHFDVLEENLFHVLKPGETKDFSYLVKPLKRGSFISNTVFFKYVGDLGLCVKYAKRKMPIDYKVYPNLRDLSKYRLIIQKDRLLNYIGRPIKIWGQGTEFESLREYVLGDDVRRINWPATARERKLIMNNYEPERNQPVTIMIDTGRAMSYSVKGFKKLDYAINAALILSDIVNQKGDLSGLIVYDTDVLSSIKAGKGPVHRNLLMETLYHIEDSRNTPDYETAFKEVNRLQPRRSIVFIFTDFETMEESEDILKNISLISKKHIPIIMLVRNESAEKLLKTSNDSMENIFVKSAAYDFLSERAKIIKSLNTRGVKCIETDAESFAIGAVNKYLELKSRM